jgi:hypothetical protein
MASQPLSRRRSVLSIAGTPPNSPSKNGAAERYSDAIAFAKQYLSDGKKSIAAHFSPEPTVDKIMKFFGLARTFREGLCTQRARVETENPKVLEFLEVRIGKEAFRALKHFFEFSPEFDEKFFKEAIHLALDSNTKKLSETAARMISGRRRPDTAPLKNWTWKKKLAVALPFALLAAGIITGVAIFLWRRHVQKTKALPAPPEPTVKPPVEPVQPPPPGPNRPLLPRRPDPLADKVRRT